MAAESVGQIGLDLVVNQKGFNKQMQGITGLAKKAGAALAAAFAVKKLIDFGKEAVKLGSDLEEVQNVVDVVFTSMSNKVDEFAKGAATSFGLSETMAKKYTGTFGAMSKAFGFTEKQAYDMSTALTALTGDVASFYNITQDGAYTKLKSVFTGETETLKDLGVVMTQTALDAYAMANGYGKTTKAMSEAEKVALRYTFVQNQLSLASGDFARNSNSWANQTRLLSLQFDSLKASIGQGLINVLLPVIKLLNTLLAKIQSVASAFSALTAKVFGKADTSAKSVASSVEGIGSATEGAVGGIEDASKAAKKAAKEAKTSATSIDELNIVSPDNDTDTGPGGSGGGAAGGLGADIGGEIESAEQKSSPVLDAMKKKLQELADIFKTGFKIGLGDTNFEEIGAHVNGIKESLKRIFTDSVVLSAADNWADTVALSLGKITGSAASIGLTVAELVTGSLDKYLVQNEGFIKDRIVGILDVSSRGAEIAGNFAVTMADIFTVFRGDSAKQIGADLIAIFENSFLSTIELSLRFGVDLLDALTGPIIENKDKIKEALENTLEPISTITSAISEFVTNTWEKIFETYDQYVSPAFENFKAGLSTVVSAILDAYNTYFAPVLGWVAERINWVIVNAIQPMVNAFLGLAGRIIEVVSMIWNYISPFVGWFAEVFIAGISTGLAFLWTIIEKTVTVFTNVITTVVEVLNGFIDVIVGVFTGDWERAWEGIKGIFQAIWNFIKQLIQTVLNAISNIVELALTYIKNIINTILSAIKLIFQKIFDAIHNTISFWGENMRNTVSGVINKLKSLFSGGLETIKSTFINIFNSIKDQVSSIFTGLWTNIKGTINSILGGIQGMANGVVSGVNKVISALNGLKFDIPDWIPGLGGKSFGFSIPTLGNVSIPRLAQGGYVKANTPQLAMIGDNRHQGEVVAPEDKMLEMALTAAKLASQDNLSAELLNQMILLLKQILSAISNIDFTAEIDGRTLITMIKSLISRSGLEMES